MKKTIQLLLSCFIICSCTVYGIGDDYDKIPDHYLYRIKSLESFHNLNNNFIYKITGEQLADELKNHSKAVVYIFTNGTYLRLKPLQDYIDFAKEKDYKLFFVMDGYMNLRQTLEELSTYPSPVFAINHDIASKNYKPHYVSRFQKDLNVEIFKDEQKIIYFNCLLYFENGKFIKKIEEYSGSKPRNRISINGK